MDSVQSQPNALFGNLYVDILGGGTFRTEMNVLTGTDHHSGIFPNFVYKKTQTLSKVYGEQPHRMVLHPNDGWFYNRQNAYASLDFNTFLFKENCFTDPSQRKGWFPSNDALMDVYKSNHKNGEISILLTMQNHGSYNDRSRYGEALEKGEIVKIASTSYAQGLPDITKIAWENYFFGIKDDDKLIKDLYEYYQKGAGKDEPTILIFWGDHLPALARNLGDIKELSQGELGLTDEEYGLFSHTVPYGIIANDKAMSGLDLQEKFDKLKEEDNLDFNSRYLGAMIYSMVGANEDYPWFNFLNTLREKLPINNLNMVLDKDGKLTTKQTEEQKKIIRDLSYWNYSYLLH
jgi:hypothetical protein